MSPDPTIPERYIHSYWWRVVYTRSDTKWSKFFLSPRRVTNRYDSLRKSLSTRRSLVTGSQRVIGSSLNVQFEITITSAATSNDDFWLHIWYTKNPKNTRISVLVESLYSKISPKWLILRKNWFKLIELWWCIRSGRNIYTTS